MASVMEYDWMQAMASVMEYDWMYRDLAIPPVGRLDFILVDTEIILCEVHCCHYPLGWSVFLQSLILLPLLQCICPVDSQLVKLILQFLEKAKVCLLYTSPSPRDDNRSRMPSSA